MSRFLILFTVVLLFACSGQTKEVLFQQGNNLRDQGNFRGAIVLYKNALEKDPNYLEARTELAETYLTAGNLDKAENEFQKVLHQNPSASKILLKLATVYIQQKKPEAALLELDKFHSSNSETVDSLTLYGLAHAETGDLESAEKLFNKALKIDPDAVAPRFNLAKIYIQRKNFDQARQYLKEIIERDKEYVQAYYLLARLETSTGHRDDGLKVYQALVKADPKQPQAYYMIGMLQIDMGDLDAAEKTVEHIISAFKDRPEGYRLKGMLLYRQGKNEDAILALETSLKSQQHPLTYFFLGLSQYGLDRLELALNQFQKALDLNPDFERARILISMILLKQKRIDDAIIEIQKVLRNNQNSAYAHNILGSAYLAKGQYDEGMAELEKATEIDPNLADAHMKIGLFHMATGEEAEGEADLLKAVEVAPEVLNSRLMLVTHYLKQRNYSAAIEALQAGMDGSKKDALLNNYLAAAYFSQQKPEKALEALQKAKSINPDYLTPYFNVASYYASKSEYQRAIDEYQSILSHDSKNLKALFSMAAVYSLQGKTDQMLDVYKQIEATDTEKGFFASGAYWAKQKDYSRALSIANRGLEVYKESTPLLEMKGGLQESLKQFDDAESTYTRLSGIAPEKGNQLLVRLYIQNGKTDKAKQFVEHLLKSDADKDFPYLLASKLDLNLKQPQEAVQILLKGINHVQNKLRLQMQLANVYGASGNSLQAEQTYQKIVEETPRFSPAYTSLGIINEQRGDKGKALDLYRTALKYDNNNVAALNNLAFLLADNFGQESEALEFAMNAYRIKPDDPRIMDTLGYVLLKNKRAEDALRLLEKANELLPDMPTVKLHLAMAKAETGEKKAAKELLTQVLSAGSADDIKLATKILKSL